MKVFLAAVAALVCSGAMAQVHPVAVERRGEGWTLLRDGAPYVVKGGGGWTDLELLKASGGNSIRLWGLEGAKGHLDAAEKLGLTATLGIWMGHERHGFSYNKTEDVAKLLKETREAAAAYKDHPALLVWGVGNEMEAEKPENAAIWMAVNAVAAEIKKIDKSHPTMVVVAEIGTTKLRHIEELCPDIDLVGVNSYGGAASLPERYRKMGGKKPYILTEFGPGGYWESEKTEWGASVELSSTRKAGVYAEVYRKVVVGDSGWCLGSYAFTWGHKQEATATWFGLLLTDGTRLGGVDALSELWTGKAPGNRCPEIKSLTLTEGSRVKPGAVVHAKLEVSDPEGDAVSVQWVLMEEQRQYSAGGDATPKLKENPGAIVKSDLAGAEIRVPEGAIGYRLYAFARDGKGGGATANVPFTAAPPPPTPPPPTPATPVGAPAKLPVVVYGEGGKEGPFTASGWMGNTGAMKLDLSCKESPKSGETCLRFTYSAADGWGAIAWQSPAGDWGDKAGGLNLTGAKALTFWARGGAGGEKVDFKVGLIGKDKAFPDSDRAEVSVELTKEWTAYRVELRGKDLGRIKTGFVMAVAGRGSPITVDVDEVRFE